MSGLACNSCNKELENDAEQKFHYKSEWHRYNLKRKMAGVPGVTEALFEARQAAIAQVKVKAVETPMLYSCGICDKGYRSSKAHEQHLKSKSHVLKASKSNREQDMAIIKQLPPRRVEKNNPDLLKGSIEEESEDEWVEVDSDEDLDEEMDESGSGEDMDDDDIEFELETSLIIKASY